MNRHNDKDARPKQLYAPVSLPAREFRLLSKLHWLLVFLLLILPIVILS
jgi:hypothetical protein